MKSSYKILIVLTVLLLFTSSTEFHAQTIIVKAFPNLTFQNPIDIQQSGDNSNRLFVVSQTGIINVFKNESSVTSSSVFLDIRNKIVYGGERGLLGLAFHPNYISNGYFYINYTINSPLRTIVSRFEVSTNNLDEADELSEQILLEVEQPFQNHNGGQIAFGPDGYLYISFGDGGSGGDPGNRAQNLSTLLGKIVRINVDAEGTEKPYSIPSDNPFASNTQNFAEEIFAYGLRNVWRFSFDGTGRLWAADVGQNAWEEINLIENGRNYGWRIMEGFHCYNPSNNCVQTGLELPVWEYGHNQSGGYSITGGYLYEGVNAPELLNKYIYGDFASANIWAFDPSDNSNSFLLKHSGPISTFGIDQNKDLYFADYNSGDIYKFIDNSLNSVPSSDYFNFSLDQNYPNPFNPSTTIQYSIPNVVDAKSLPTGRQVASTTDVQLKIYDIIGSEVATIVNKQQAAGNYKVEFDASKLTSGIYFYTIRAGNFIQTKKMILLK